MEITPLIGSVATGYGAGVPTDPLHTYGENAEDLKSASRDFVSILFSQMFSAMRGNPDDQASEEEGGSFFGGENVSMFMGFLDQEIGKKFSEQGGKDLVDALYVQLKGNNALPENNKGPGPAVADIVNPAKIGLKEVETKATGNVIVKNDSRS